MSEWNPPNDREEALKRRQQATDQFVKTQQELAAINLQLKQTIPLAEYRALVRKKGILVEDQKQLSEELRKLRQWREQLTKENKPTTQERRKHAEVSDEWDGTLDLARQSFSDLWRYVSWLENRVKELEAENKQLQEIEIAF